MKYRKKPVEIEAYLWEANLVNPTKDNVPKWLEEIIKNGDICFEWQNNDWVLIILTLDGNVTVNRGGYIIQGVKGELYPCKGDIFKMTYERVVD